MDTKRSHTGNGKICSGRLNHDSIVVSVVSSVLENVTQLDLRVKAQWRSGAVAQWQHFRCQIENPGSNIVLLSRVKRWVISFTLHLSSSFS